MKRHELEKEGKKWVAEGIISEDQLQRILSRKPETGPNYMIILFAVLLTGLGFLTFIMSDWAREPHLSRVVIILLAFLFFYILGDVIYRRNKDIYGISFIVLGYIVFGAGLLLVIDIYQVTVYSAWPFVIWTVVGLLLFLIYEHRLIFSVVLLIGTVGQLYSGLSFSDFNWILFALIVVGAGYFAWRESLNLFYYLLAISFSLQSIVLTMTVFEHYYWYIIPILVLYVFANLRNAFPFRWVALVSIFIFGMYQAFLLQDGWFSPQIPDFELSFFIIWFLLFALAVALTWRKHRQEQLVDFLLFLPLVFLPGDYLFSLIVLFLFSLGWIFIGYNNQNQQAITLGTVAFLFSTLTVYIQFAWDALNRSLFFFIGGLLLFIISFILEKQRRNLSSKGSDQL